MIVRYSDVTVAETLADCGIDLSDRTGIVVREHAADEAFDVSVDWGTQYPTPEVWDVLTIIRED